MTDRSSRPLRSPARLPRQLEHRIASLRFTRRSRRDLLSFRERQEAARRLELQIERWHAASVMDLSLGRTARCAAC